MVSENIPTPPKRYVAAEEEIPPKPVAPLKQRDEIDTIRAYFKSPAIALDGSRATKLVRVMFERENFFLSFHNFLELQKNITHLYTTKKK